MRAFLLLVLSVSTVLHAASPKADQWIGGVKFALPVECAWDEGLGQRPEAQLQALQDLLTRAMIVAARHASGSSVFQWSRAAIPSDRRLSIVLTDRDRPMLGGELLPVQTQGMIGITAPTMDDKGVVAIHAILELGDTVALGRDGKLRSDALGRVVAALGHTLLGAVPSYLAMTGAQLARATSDSQTYFLRFQMWLQLQAVVFDGDETRPDALARLVAFLARW